MALAASLGSVGTPIQPGIGHTSLAQLSSMGRPSDDLTVNGTGNLWNRSQTAGTRAGGTEYTNRRTTYHLIVRPMPPPYDRLMRLSQRYKPMFQLRDTQPRVTVQFDRTMAPEDEVYGGAGVTRGGGLGRRRNPGHTVVTLAAWNYLAAEQRRKAPPQHPYQVGTAQEQWARWTLLGVVMSEAGEEQWADTVHPQDVTRQHRIINVLQKGTGPTFNIWGRQIRPMTNLWFIVKQVQMDPEGTPFRVAVEEPRTWGTLVSKVAQWQAGAGVPGGPGSAMAPVRPFQLVPYAHPDHESPPLSALKYEDEFGFKHVGVAIYVGTVEDTGFDEDTSVPLDVDAAQYDDRSMLLLPMISIFANPRFAGHGA